MGDSDFNFNGRNFSHYGKAGRIIVSKELCKKKKKKKKKNFMGPFLSSRIDEWSTSWVWSSPPDLGPRRPTVMACASQQGSDWLQPANRAMLTAGQRSCRQGKQGCPLSSRMPGSAPLLPMRCQWQSLPSRSQLQMLPDESWRANWEALG